MLPAYNPIKFSIVTVCLNAGADLTNTVGNTLAQTYSDFEIIVKDGLSRDGCLSGLPEDPRIRVVEKKDSSIYDAMNQALEYVTGDYVIFMNCGDYFYCEETLQQIADAIGDRREKMYYGLCYNRLMDNVIVPPPKMTEFSCFRTMICHQSTVYAAELFRERKYDTSFKILADKEYLYHCIIGEKLSPVYIDRVLSNYQGGGESEKETHRQTNKTEHKRILQMYFPTWKRGLFSAAYQLTLPGVRRFLANDPRVSKLYFGTVRKLYALLPKRKRI